MREIDFSSVKTPAYLVDERLLGNNLKVLKNVMDRTGCRILLAQKGFSMYAEYPLIGKYLCGTTASSLYEAMLGKEYMAGETHIFAPAYREEEFDTILETCDHIVFNSLEQWLKYRTGVEDYCARTKEEISCGIRVNPEYAEVEHEIYNPCCKGSRLGTTLAAFQRTLQQEPNALEGISGLHFHALCEQNSDTLERVLKYFLERFGHYIKGMQWINFGGGHHITRPDYDIERLIHCIELVQREFDVEVYLEPGEAIALNTGYLVSTVLDVQRQPFVVELDQTSYAYNFGANSSYADGVAKLSVTPVILDTSAACHMPDVLEMPYRPMIIGSGLLGEKAYNYRLGGNTCLAGDIIGDYSFDRPLEPGTKLVFTDMAHYSMVKNNTFNGIGLPSILAYNDETGIRTIKEFGYQDFKGRLS